MQQSPHTPRGPVAPAKSVSIKSVSNRLVAYGLGAVVLFTAACAVEPSSKGKNFKGRYLVARDALETGSYKKAISSYKTMMPEAGPLEARLRLEYAHSLLRSDQFIEAGREARLVAANQQGAGRLAALAVQGTADHEAALAALAAGQNDSVTKARLAAAGSALDEVLKDRQTFDPLGTLTQRRAAIKTTLAGL